MCETLFQILKYERIKVLKLELRVKVIGSLPSTTQNLTVTQRGKGNLNLIPEMSVGQRQGRPVLRLGL